MDGKEEHYRWHRKIVFSIKFDQKWADTVFKTFQKSARANCVKLSKNDHYISVNFTEFFKISWTVPFF